MKISKSERKSRCVEVDESFDAANPVAEAIRSLMPSDSEMDAAARERMMGHLFSVQRRQTRQRDVRHRRRAHRALIPAVAVLLAICVLAAVLLPVFLRQSKPAPSNGYARLGSVSGKVEVKTSTGKWKSAGKGSRVGAGWSIRTGGGSLASVVFPGGSIMRMSDDSQAHLVSMTARSIEVEHVAGDTYHRVHPGTRYTVSNSGVQSRALGTAFNVDNRAGGNLEILSVEHAVEVAIGGHEPIKVSEGEVMLVSLKQGKRAVMQPVSRERLADRRLCASVERDAQAGYSTGIYGKLDVSLTSGQAPQSSPTAEPAPISLNGTADDKGVELDWTRNPDTGCVALVLLRSELSEPEFPGAEIARYTDTSISSATDDGVAPGHTYQYRIAALSGTGGVSAYSNTVVIPVDSSPALEEVSITLSASPGPNGVTLEWGVSGATRFTGFIVERVVEKAPDGSDTPAGTTSTRTVDSTNVFFTFQDNSVLAGYSYTYRVGLVVDGAVMFYSAPRTVDVTKP